MAAASGVGPLFEAVRSRAPLPDGPLLIALSGGADSAVLAAVAAAGTQVVRAVFVDHGLAGSPALRRAAEQIAGALDIGLDVEAAPVGRDTPSFENAARLARYAALQAAAKPDEWILTGHTSDDQAETVLGNVLRGAGAAGLSGIPARRGRLARPLLSVSRRETRELASILGLPFVDDPDNESTDLRRNRIRSELLPRLEADYNPQLRTALLRTGALLTADDDALEALAGRVPVLVDSEAVSIPAPAFAVVPAAVAGRVVRRALRALRGPHAGTHEDVCAVLAVAAGLQGGAEISGAVRVDREGALVVLHTGEVAPAPLRQVELPGTVDFDRWHLTLDVTGEPPLALGGHTLILDADRVGAVVTLRPGIMVDRIDIGTGSKTVGDALAEAGIPRRLRSRWPVMEAHGKVACIPGVRAGGWAWRGPGTTRYLVARIIDSGEGN